MLACLGLQMTLLGQVSCERQDQGPLGVGEGQPRSGTSALIIVGDDSKVVALSLSIPYIDIKHARNISIVDLVPGSKPIRLTIFSQRAIEYMKSVQAPMHKLLEVIQSEQGKSNRANTYSRKENSS